MRVLPWLLALAILGFVITRVPRDELVAALSHVSLWRLLVLAAAFVITVLAVDSLALWIAFKASLSRSPVSYGSVLLMRGASHLLAQVSYAAGQGGMVYLLRQRHQVPITSGAGAVLLANGAFIIVTALTVAAGLWAGAVPDRPELRMVAISVAAALPVYLLVLACRPGILARRRLLSPFFQAGARGSIQVAGCRALHLGVLITGHVIAMRLFGIEVPMAVALAGLPVLFLIGSLPISPSGLGTTQAAAITLFGSFAPGQSSASEQAVVLAYSLSFQVIVSLMLLGVGLFCLHRIDVDLPGRHSRPAAPS